MGWPPAPLPPPLGASPQAGELTFQVPPLVVQHDIFAVEHFVADFASKLLVPVFLLVFGKVTVGGEESETHLTLERLVICPGRKQTQQLSGKRRRMQAPRCGRGSGNGRR